MNRALTDLLLKRMFLARRVVLRAGALCVGLFIAGLLDDYAHLLTQRGELLLLATPSVISLLVMLAGSLVTCYYVFRAGLSEVGLGYAIGHSMLCAALSGLLFIGVIVVPLLVRADIERLRQSEGEPPSGFRP